MNNLLFDDYLLTIQPTLAKAIGLHEAIILQQIHYWIKLPTGGERINGEHWIYNSLSDWKKQFPFISESSIHRAIENLEWAELIKTGNYNKRKGDKTKWYTINYETVNLLNVLVQHEKEIEDMEKSKKGVPRWDEVFQDGTNYSQDETPSCQDGTTLPETTTETIPYILLSKKEPEETSNQVFEKIPSASKGAPPPNLKIKSKQKKGIADPMESFSDEEKLWAEHISDVLLQPVHFSLDALPRGMAKDCVWQARDCVRDLHSGKYSAEDLREAFSHLMNGAGAPYRQSQKKAYQVVQDATGYIFKKKVSQSQQPNYASTYVNMSPLPT